jgi:hypothetical protein
MCADENVLISEDTAEDVLIGEEQESEVFDADTAE